MYLAQGMTRITMPDDLYFDNTQPKDYHLSMKTIEAYSLYQAIQRVQNENVPRPVKFGYALAVNIKNLQVVAEAFEAARTELITQFSFKDIDGKSLIENDMFKIDDQLAFTKGMTELQNSEVEVTLVKLTIDEMPSQLEPFLVGMFLPMIKDAV